MEVNREKIDELVYHFVKGDITAEDLGILDAYIRQSEDNRQYVRDLREIIFTHQMMTTNKKHDVEAAIARFHRYLANKEKPQLKILPWKKMLGVAAVILLILLPIVGYFLGKSELQRHFAMIETSAPKGSLLDVTLPDGTTVRLNSGSTIRYSQGFGIINRDIHLQGEGFFSVSHDENLPMKVVTRDIVVYDLGTSFKVSGYVEDKETMIELYEGKLEFDNLITHHEGYFLHPGEKVVVDKTTGKVSREKIKKTKEDGKRMNDLYFEDATLVDIVRVLSRTYGVRIDVDSSVAEKRFHLFFDRNAIRIDQILNEMTLTKQINCRKTGDRYLLY